MTRRPASRGDGQKALADLQAWFGRAVSRPLPDAYGDNPLRVSAPGLEAEADARLRAKGGMGGFDRLGVYNQQYWFRLVSVMQSDYAAAIHLMGLKAFNDQAVAYLTAHPPASPFLADLDAHFPAFLRASYRGPGREAVLQAVAYERALSRAFDAPEGASLAASGKDPALLMAEPLRLAPHATPLHIDWDFAEYRARCLGDESLEAEMDPPLPAAADLVIHRAADLEVRKTPVAPAALAVLQAFPGALPEVFGRLEGKLSAEDQAALEAGLLGWFQAWAADGWLCLAAGGEEGGGDDGAGKA